VPRSGRAGHAGARALIGTGTGGYIQPEMRDETRQRGLVHARTGEDGIAGLAACDSAPAASCTPSA
jgi:hypothetical protein